MTGRGPLQPDRVIAALLLVDSRHPGLDNDRAAWGWLRGTATTRTMVATKVDTLAHAATGIRGLRELESVFEHPALPGSASRAKDWTNCGL